MSSARAPDSVVLRPYSRTAFHVSLHSIGSAPRPGGCVGTGSARRSAARSSLLRWLRSLSFTAGPSLRVKQKKEARRRGAVFSPPVPAPAAPPSAPPLLPLPPPAA